MKHNNISKNRDNIRLKIKMCFIKKFLSITILKKGIEFQATELA